MMTERRAPATDWVYTGLRIVAAWVYLQHGTQKLFNIPAPFGADHLPPLMLAAGIIEVVGGVLLIVGLASRITAFICSGEMAAAYFMAHAPHGFLWTIMNHGESPAILSFLFLYIALAGPGPYSFDAMLARARRGGTISSPSP
jgi:putative oxidoreductase